MNHIRAGQIKAARAILDWSQEDLAEITGLSVATIRNLEMGYISPRISTTSVIREAVENAGLEFIDFEGVRRRLEDVRIFHGDDSGSALLENMRATQQKIDLPILASMLSQQALAEAVGAPPNGHRNQLAKLCEIAEVKCLVSSASEMPYPLPRLHYRIVARVDADPVPYFIYGNKQAIVLAEGSSSPKIIGLKSPSIALAYRAHFQKLWERATPFAIQNGE